MQAKQFGEGQFARRDKHRRRDCECPSQDGRLQPSLMLWVACHALLSIDPSTKPDPFPMTTLRTLPSPPPPGNDSCASLLQRKETSREKLGVWTPTHSLVTAPHVEETLIVSRIHAKLRALVVDEERFLRDRSRVLSSAQEVCRLELRQELVVQGLLAEASMEGRMWESTP